MSHTTSVKSVPIRDITALRAAVNDLQQAGVRCELLENEVPRMYYKDQLRRHLGRDSEVCDYVLRLHDADYDVALIKQEDGSYTPVFDDWVRSEGRGIKHIIGAAFKGKVEHWSGNRSDTEQTLHSIGKFLQHYSKNAAINAAVAQGYIIEETSLDEEGNYHLRVSL